MADAEQAQRLGEQPGDVAGAVVGHDPLDLDAVLANQRAARTRKPVVEDRALVGQDLDVGEPCGVIDRDMEEVVANADCPAPAVAGDAVADIGEAGELLDVEVDQLPRPLTLITADRFRLGQVLQATEPASLKPPATVERASVSLMAIASAVSRYSRRNRSIRATVASARRLVIRSGREERFSSPANHRASSAPATCAPSAR